MNLWRTLLVNLDDGPQNLARLRIARLLAERHGAEVRAVYAVAPALVDLPGEAGASLATAQVLKQLDDERRDRALSVLRKIEQETGPVVAWDESIQDPVTGFCRHALYADLLVLGQHAPDQAASGVPADFVPTVLAASGRPALVLPAIDLPLAPGKVVLVAWKESAECARVLAGALPLLASAQEVHVAEWRDEGARPDRRRDIQRHLASHGIEARMHRHGPAGAQVGELMLSLAADLSADTLVMGCYGHSRAHEFMLGGATQTVLRSMTLPTLMAH